MHLPSPIWAMNGTQCAGMGHSGPADAASLATLPMAGSVCTCGGSLDAWWSNAARGPCERGRLGQQPNRGRVERPHDLVWRDAWRPAFVLLKCVVSNFCETSCVVC